MSLLHRAGSVESFSRRASLARDESNGRRMSFNPVGKWVRPVALEQPIEAPEVSKALRISQVAAAVVYCLFSAGIVFGYAALKPVLIQEHVHRDLCTEQELKDQVEVCYEQEIRMNFMFTVAAVATNVCALPIGTILDRFGPRVASLIGCVFMAIGCLFMAFAWDMRPVDGYTPGYFFLALGGPFIFISSFQLSNTFPRYSGLILALLTGSFDTSSAIFLFYRLIYTASNASFWPKKFFLVYLIVPILIAIVQILIMPKVSYKTDSEVEDSQEENMNGHSSHAPGASPDLASQNGGALSGGRRESTFSEITSLLGLKSIPEDDDSTVQKAKIAKSGVYGVLHGRSAFDQIKTPWFALIAAFTLIQMLRINYFVATIRPQYTFLLDSADTAKRINSFFDVALPLGGVVAIPFIGLLLDNTSTPVVLGVLVAIATVIGILGTLPFQWAAYANIVLFVLYRPLYYTTVSDYAAKVFGFVTFGKVYGAIICLAGLFNFLQTPLDAATHKSFQNSPVPINLILTGVAALVGIALVTFVAAKSRALDRERLEQEAEGSADSLIPGADGRATQDRHPVNVHGYGSIDRAVSENAQ